MTIIDNQPCIVSSHLVLGPPLILHHGLRINLHLLRLSFLLLNQGGTGHAEDAVDVDAHFHLHFGAVAIRLGNHILDGEAAWGRQETLC